MTEPLVADGVAPFVLLALEDESDLLVGDTLTATDLPPSSPPNTAALVGDPISLASSNLFDPGYISHGPGWVQYSMFHGPWPTFIYSGTVDNGSVNAPYARGYVTSRCENYVTVEIWEGSAVFQIRDVDTLAVVKTFNVGTYAEPKWLHHRTDGRWLCYYTTGHSSQNRRIGVLLSDSADISASWTDQGFVLSGSGPNDQRYHIAVNDDLTAQVHRYDKSTESITVDRYSSTDGIVWTLEQADWLTDGVMVWAGNIHAGVLYYVSVPVGHNAPLPRGAILKQVSV